MVFKLQKDSPLLIIQEKQRSRKHNSLIMAAIFLFLLLISAFSTSKAQHGRSNISLGSSLSPTNNSYWLSDSGQFAFGFYPSGNGFAVGIWFASIQEKTVIWTANRDDAPLSRDVTLLLTEGGLVSQLKKGEQTPIVNAQSAASASMLDSGNFVLYNSDSMIIWRSFDVPTDTILPGQHLLAGKELVSSISDTNHSSGIFQLNMQKDGNLVQYPVGKVIADFAYWDSKTFTAGDNVTLILEGNGHLYLLNTTGFNIKNLYKGMNSSAKYIYRMTLDTDGILRLYSHNLDQNGNWSIEWSSTNNKCNPLGLCGLNGYCVMSDQDPVCLCLPGFDFIDQGQRNLGCNRNVSIDGCISKNANTKYTMHELEGTTWEDSPYSILSSMTKLACRDDCLRDCNCEGALFKEQQCRKQKFPLKYGKTLVDQVTTFVKVGSGGSGTTMVDRENKKDQQLSILITGITFLTSAFVVLAISSVIVYKYRIWEYKKILNHGNGNEELVEDVTLRSFKYAELEKATNGFTDEVGKGAFGTVFKGVISNGMTVIAVKRLERVMAEGEREFRNEMKAIGRTHHKNLVRLLGYCHDGTNRLLVYEYMSNGSLANFLFKSEEKPHWEERIGIALSVARGIFYLHEECQKQIIHCDIKPENILMGENHCAKIADFGLAKLLMSNQTRTYTGIRGTRGYVAPEWHRNLPITVKADVYSFGIMLLEIICCRRSVAMDAPEEEAVLAYWVYDCFQASELDKLVKDEEVDKIKLERMVMIGLWCIQHEPSLRPPIKKVVLMLEGTVDIPAPPSPSSFFSAI